MPLLFIFLMMTKLLFLNEITGLHKKSHLVSRAAFKFKKQSIYCSDAQSPMPQTVTLGRSKTFTPGKLEPNFVSITDRNSFARIP